MGSEKLQALSKQYALGEIAKPEYRQKRKNIINQATGEAAQTPSNSVASTHDSTPASTQIESSIIKKAGVISVVIVATLIIVYIAI